MKPLRHAIHVADTAYPDLRIICPAVRPDPKSLGLQALGRPCLPQKKPAAALWEILLRDR
jgi:hypothetical protein